MLLHLKTPLKLLVLPPAGLILLAGAGALLLRRRPMLGRMCLIAGLGSLWLLSTPVVSDAVVSLTEHYPAMDLRSAGGAQAVVILGGGGQRSYAPEYGGPAADPELLERLSYGAYVARKTGLPILVTGYHIEAVAMQGTLMRNFSIAPRWVEDQAYDTFENAANSVRMLEADGVRRIILVTHATHMWRAVHEFTDAGIEVVPAPAGMRTPREYGIKRFEPNPSALSRACAAINELVGEPVRALLAASHLRRH